MALMNLIYLLIIFDAIMVFAFLFLVKGLKSAPLPLDLVQALREISEERHHLEELRSTISQDLHDINASTRTVLDQVKAIATEAELEVKEGTELIRNEMDTLIKDMSTKIQEPLEQFTKKKRAIENLLEQIREEKRLYNKIVLRSEKVAKVLNTAKSYDDVLEQIQTQKYTDARELVARGHDFAKVADELGIPIEQVKLLARQSYE